MKFWIMLTVMMMASMVSMSCQDDGTSCPKQAPYDDAIAACKFDPSQFEIVSADNTVYSRCKDNILQESSKHPSKDQELWIPIIDCSRVDARCQEFGEDAECVKSCSEEGAISCFQGEVFECRNGKLEHSKECASVGGSCSDGKCILPKCDPLIERTPRCDGNTLNYCNEEGELMKTDCQVLYNQIAIDGAKCLEKDVLIDESSMKSGYCHLTCGKLTDGTPITDKGVCSKDKQKRYVCVPLLNDYIAIEESCSCTSTENGAYCD